MCGIAGFNWPDKELIKKMTDRISHRGPDGEGFFIDNISLGHRRLSILDLSEKGSQPMKFDDLVITFNGEIYNYKEIRQELIQIGHSFVSDTDTEVIIHAYQQWGKDLVGRLNGMWAFCIYDKSRDIFFLSRDRFGIKPLYFYTKNQKFIFGSELRVISIHNIDLEIDINSLNHFFYQKYIGNNQSVYTDMQQVPPGHNCIYELDTNQTKLDKYFDLDAQIQLSAKIPINERIQQIEFLIKDAVSKRLISDVPVGSFLSGGVDSSLISAIIASNHDNFKTFSIGFNENTFDESNYSKIVSKFIKTNHYIETLAFDDKVIENIISHLDEPFGDASVLPTALLSQITRKQVTVALSGDAADEIFGGYDVYKAFVLAKYIPKSLIKSGKHLSNFYHGSDSNLSFLFKVKKFFNDFDENVERRHLNWLSQSNNNQRFKLLGNFFLPLDEFSKTTDDKSLLSVQQNDINNYLVGDILKKVDIASMMHSLEVRVPFLDYRLVPLVLSLPDNLKIRYLQTKYHLKKIAENYLPKQIITRPKQGFAVPISKWLKSSNLMQEYLLGNYYSHGYFNKSYVEELFSNHKHGKTDNSRILWLIFIFNYWFENK